MLCGGATGSHVTGSYVTGSDVSHVTGRNVNHRKRKYVIRTNVACWPEVTSVTWPEEAMSVSMFCACATGSCAISALVWAFWLEVTSVTWPEEALSGSRLCACPIFPAVFLNSSNMATGCDRRSFDPSEFPWVCATGSCATPVVVVNNVGWGVLYNVRVL